MNWSSLLPSTRNPAAALKLLFDANSNNATHGLRDTVIFLTFGIAIFFAGIVLWQTLASWLRTRPYLSLTRGGEQAVGGVIASDLSFFREFRHHLIDIPSRDGKGVMSKRRTVDAAEVFRESALGPAFSSSRLVLAIPSILTGLGVLGTFVGLQLGIGSLDLKNPGNLDKSIVPLIEGCAVAFSSSVWGVLASLLFSGWEKAWEGFALGRVRKIQIRVDALFPRYVPEDAMAEIQRTSSGADESLKSLAVAIGAEMQKAIGRLGAEIKDAVSNATAEGHGPLMEKSAELLSSVLTAELVKLKEQIGSMADQFSEKFNGASDGLVNSVQGFQPTVEALSAVVGDAQRAVTAAVAKLNDHEGVMAEMAGAAENIRVAADTFGAVSETLTISAGRNEEASQAQLLAAQSNERVAEQFGRIGDGLPELRQALEDAARVIGSLDSKLEEQIGGMANQFSDKFNGASAGLMKSVQGFQPAVEALSGAMGDAQRIVADAVAKLNAHEGVMLEMAGAAVNIRQAAETFGAMNDTLTLSAARNEEASKAQLSAAQSNERVAEQFGRIGEGLPKISETVKAAAEVIGSLGVPIRDLRTMLEGQPELQHQLDTARSTSESERSQMLLTMAGNLAEKVGIAAQQFAQVGALADKLRKR